MFDVTGTWEGHYEYNDDGALAGRLVPFVVVLRARLFRRFAGSVEEDATTGIPEKASVAGWWKSRTLSFEKRYSRLWTVDDAGRIVSLDDHVRQKYGTTVVVPPAYAHPRITYAGIINDHDGAVMGTWHHPAVHGDLGSGGSIVLPESFGTFALRRMVDRVYRPRDPHWR